MGICGLDSATVFGVSTESMQLSYDHRGNSIPTILLLMQRHMYSRHGLQVHYHLLSYAQKLQASGCHIQ